MPNMQDIVMEYRYPTLWQWYQAHQNDNAKPDYPAAIERLKVELGKEGD